MTTKKKKAAITRDPDTDLLQEIIEAMMKPMGRGALTYFATRCGTSVSNFRKRLKSAQGAFDPITARAAILVLTSKAEHFKKPPIRTEKSGRFIIDMHEENGVATPTWRTK